MPNAIYFCSKEVIVHFDNLFFSEMIRGNEPLKLYYYCKTKNHSMKKLILAFLIVYCSLYASGQTNTILFQDFETTPFPPTDWAIIDYDEDGKNWYQRTDSQTGNKLASSRSWESNVALTPHNLIITSQIDLSQFDASSRLRVSYKIAATGNSYFQEHYKLVLSTTGNEFQDIDSGVILLEETLTQLESGWNFKTRIINIDDYAGQELWLAWVHYNCTDQDGLLLDDIHVYEGDDPDNIPYVSWLAGSAEDAITENHQPGIVLAGGGGDNSNAMTWFLNRADGGDVVVIRASGNDGYNNYLYSSLGLSVNSVETILINSVEAAQHPYVEQQIRNAEALFIAGGDQYDYYQYWKDTPVMDAINYLINEKGVVVGGTSAGMAILGKVYYTPSGSSAQSPTVLNNPYHSSLNIIGRDDFIDVSILENTITDTHFDQRDRSGRLFTFMSRMVKDWDIEAKGIAANEFTAVCIDIDGKAYVYGNPSYDDYAYFLKSQGCAPEICTTGQPLTWNCNNQAIKVYKILGRPTNPNYFDLSTWDEGAGGEWEYWWAEGGTLHKSPLSSAAISTINSIRVYPNPASSKLWIDIDDDNPISVELWSITGQLVLSKVNVTPNEPVDISALAKGLYIIKVNNNGSYSSHKIIITD